jgi:hypothetical protein
MNYLLIVVLLAITFDVAFSYGRRRALDDVTSALVKIPFKDEIRREIMLRLETL